MIGEQQFPQLDPADVEGKNAAKTAYDFYKLFYTQEFSSHVIKLKPIKYIMYRFIALLFFQGKVSK